jgi:hypothetical protein
MANPYCDPIGTCTNLEGRLLIEQTLQGPPLALGGDIGIGDLAGQVVLRPYIRFRYEQYWNPKELCRGPIRSVIGLAPSETMSLETRQVEQTDFVRLVQEVSERSEVVSTSGPAALMEAEGGARMTSAFLSLPVVVADKFGSFWETLGEVAGTVVGAAVGGPIGAVVGNWVGGAVGGWIGGDGNGGEGSGNGSTMGTVDQVLESVTRTSSERVLSETTTSRSTLFERTVTRTFTNPYRDRALQLRFIPVFRHFDVVTVFWEFEPGLVTNVFAPSFRGTMLSARLGDFVQRHVTDPRIVATSTADLGIQEQQPVASRRAAAAAASPLVEHLNANGEFYAKRYLKHLDLRRDVATLQEPVVNTLAQRERVSPNELGDVGRALRWSRARVQGKSIYTPFAPPNVLREALPGGGEIGSAFERLQRFLLRRVEHHKDVHLFAGTVIEPAPGECVLKNLPGPA